LVEVEITSVGGLYECLILKDYTAVTVTVFIIVVLFYAHKFFGD
jgi:hypothetical protein